MGFNIKTFVLALMLAVTSIGCVNLEPDGVYQGNKFAWNVEDLISDAESIVDELDVWEKEFYETEKVVDKENADKIRILVNRIRVRADDVLSAAVRSYEAYKRLPSGDTEKATDVALQAVRELMAEVAWWLAKGDI